MSEKKRYRIGEAVVNISTMKLELAEQIVSHAEVAQKLVAAAAGAATRRGEAIGAAARAWCCERAGGPLECGRGGGGGQVA